MVLPVCDLNFNECLPFNENKIILFTTLLLFLSLFSFHFVCYEYACEIAWVQNKYKKAIKGIHFLTHKPIKWTFNVKGRLRLMMRMHEKNNFFCIEGEKGRNGNYLNDIDQ